MKRQFLNSQVIKPVQLLREHKLGNIIKQPLCFYTFRIKRNSHLQRRLYYLLICFSIAFDFAIFIDFIDDNRLISPINVYDTMQKWLKIKFFRISSFFFPHLFMKLFWKTVHHFSTTNKAMHRSIGRCYHAHKGNLGQPFLHLYVTH